MEIQPFFFFFLMEQHFYCNTYTSNSIIKNKFLSLAHPDATSSCFNFGPYFLPHAGFQPAVEDEGYCSVLERRKYLLLCFEFTKQNALFFKLCSELCVLSYSQNRINLFSTLSVISSHSGAVTSLAQTGMGRENLSLYLDGI